MHKIRETYLNADLLALRIGVRTTPFRIGRAYGRRWWSPWFVGREDRQVAKGRFVAVGGSAKDGLASCSGNQLFDWTVDMEPNERGQIDGGLVMQPMDRWPRT